MKNARILSFPFLAGIVLLLSLLTGCSQKKNTFTSRTYHNLTSRYNGLYWANVNLEEAIQAIEKSHKDDYSKVLPVFKYGDEKSAQAAYPQLDKAIEKTKKMIEYHSMLIKGKEYCRWIDENYLTMAMAHFYKREYYTSVTLNEYVVKQFTDNPSKYAAFLWLVRAYNQMNSVVKTGPILDLLKHDKDLPGRLRDDYYAVLSDYYVRTEQYSKAEESLMQAIRYTRKKSTRGRYYFILAQIHELNNDLKKASRFYSLSASLHPGYEMEFNARLAKARTFQVENASGTKELKAELNKMLKDEKNRDYRDQIYYALGDISYREEDIPSALSHFKMSTLTSLTNTRQKGQSFLRIADIYFDKKDYKPAQAYYDSTIIFLPKDHKNYELIKNKKESLTSMIRNLNIIQTEDSLLLVSTMDTARIGKLIDGIIAKLIQEEEKKKQEQELKANSPGGSGLPGDNDPWATASTSGTWYFYNPTTVSFGFAEFYKKWGNRSLEDNWRRSVKESVIAELDGDTAKADTAKAGPIADNKTRPYYMKNIPFSDDQKTRSKARIVDAYYSLGGIYKEDLQDNAKSAETFIELLKLYPENKYKLNLYYQLYRLYTAMGPDHSGRANFYKDKILNEHPDSEYARIIRNPDYQRALMASRNEIEKYYNDTYLAYRQSRFTEVIAMVNRADSFYSSSELMPRFAMLRAFSIGRTGNLQAYENALQGVVAKYPKDDARTKAQELLDHIKKMKALPIDSTTAKDTVALRSPYTHKDSAAYQCMILISARKVNISEFKTRVSNFNGEYFRLANLNVSDVMLNMEYRIVNVGSFPTAAKAKDYFDLINQDAKVFMGFKPEEYKVYPITSENYATFYKLKSISEYAQFFTEHFLLNKNK